MGRWHLSRGDLLLLVLILALFGVGDSAYLAAQWYNGSSASWCDVSPYLSCTRVGESSYAAAGGVPTAMAGVVGFLLLTALSSLALLGVPVSGRWRWEAWMVGLAGAGTAVGVGLTLVEVLVIQALCPLCLLGFLLDLAILGLAVALVRVPSGSGA